MAEFLMMVNGIFWMLVFVLLMVQAVVASIRNNGGE